MSKNCPYDDCEWPVWSYKCKIWLEDKPMTKIIEEAKMHSKRTYIALEVVVIGSYTPIEIATKVKSILMKELAPEFEDDIDIDIICHSGDCAVEYCGKCKLSIHENFPEAT